MQIFQALGAPPPDPRASGGWGLGPQTFKTVPPLQISGYAPGNFALFIIIGVSVAFGMSNFFYIVQMQTL